MILQDKVYIVTSEWSSCNGDHDFSVSDPFFDYKEAVKWMNRNRNIELSESYEFASVEDARKCDGVVIEEDIDRFFIKDLTTEKWDEFKIHERRIKQRDSILVEFQYAGEIFTERIYIDQIDMTHYESCWDWWFGSQNEKFPKLNFELTADKDENGNISCNNMYINVYKDDNEMTPLETVNKIKWLKSWFEKKQNYGER